MGSDLFGSNDKYKSGTNRWVASRLDIETTLDGIVRSSKAVFAGGGRLTFVGSRIRWTDSAGESWDVLTRLRIDPRGLFVSRVLYPDVEISDVETRLFALKCSHYFTGSDGTTDLSMPLIRIDGHNALDKFLLQRFRIIEPTPEDVPRRMRFSDKELTDSEWTSRFLSAQELETNPYGEMARCLYGSDTPKNRNRVRRKLFSLTELGWFEPPSRQGGGKQHRIAGPKKREEPGPSNKAA